MEKTIKAQFFKSSSDMQELLDSLSKKLKTEDRYIDMKENMRIDIQKLDDNRFFIVINKEKKSGIPVLYNQEEISEIITDENQYLGELYYYLIDNNIIAGVAGLGRNLINKLEECLDIFDIYQLHTYSDMDLQMYEKFKCLSKILSVEFKLLFDTHNEQVEFLEKSTTNMLAPLFDYNTCSLEIKITNSTKNGLDRDILNLTDELINTRACKKLKVKFKDDNYDTIETNLISPKITYEEKVILTPFLSEAEALSFLKRALMYSYNV